MSLRADLIICGYGRIGCAAAGHAARSGRRPLIVETDGSRAAMACAAGDEVVQDDARRPGLIARLARSGAAEVIVCVGDRDGSELVERVREGLPRVRIQVGSQAPELADAYTRAGACNVVVEPWVAGQALASSIIR